MVDEKPYPRRLSTFYCFDFDIKISFGDGGGEGEDIVVVTTAALLSLSHL